MPLITEEVKNLYLTGGKKHKDWPDSVNIYNELKYHINKEKGGSLVTERRPNEDTESQNYRKKIDEPVTSLPILMVISILEMIRRSNDWEISFPKNENASIIETETLEYYCNQNFPIRLLHQKADLSSRTIGHIRVKGQVPAAVRPEPH